MAIPPTVPLTCTVNTLCYVDYKTPISIYKSTDYRTSTGMYHRFRPPLPQDFDARVKANINPKLLQSEPKQKEEQYKSMYTAEYTKKDVGGDAEYAPRPIPLESADYMRTMQEKMFAEPPPPIAPKISETKEEYIGKSVNPSEREVYPPNNFAYCEIKALGRDETPPIPPEQGGYYKFMDPYMTTSRLTYVPFTIHQQDGISRKDIITFYDASGFPRGVFDGMQSEYQGKYTMQTYFDSYPTIHTSIEDYDESLPKAGPWQTLIAPGMYCTDYCHIGTAWPVRSVVEPKNPENHILRDIELCRNEQYDCE